MSIYPTCDTTCTEMGWIEAIASCTATDLHISYAPGTDLDDAFVAFCHDEQEMIRVKGWLADINPIKD